MSNYAIPIPIDNSITDRTTRSTTFVLTIILIILAQFSFSYAQSNPAEKVIPTQPKVVDRDKAPFSFDSNVPLEQFQAYELQLVVNPPSHMTTAEIDKALAELRWTIARRIAPKDVASAIRYARSSLKIQETRPDRWEQLGDLYTLSGERTSARDAAVAYDNALFLDPTRIDARVKLASAYLMSSQIQQSLKHLELSLCQAVDQQQQMRILRIYITACIVGNQTKRGIAFCQTLAVEPLNVPFQIAWAILEKSQGNRDKAVTLLSELAKKEGVANSISDIAEMLLKKYGENKGGTK